jgi:hypothetical protein
VFFAGTRRRRNNNNTYNNTFSFTMATPSRGGGGGGNRVPKQHISKRVLNRWETLVYEAMMAEKRRQSARQGGGGGDDDGFGGGDTTTSSAAFVPQSLQQQRNIDAILRAADEVQQDDPQVARICKLCLQACIFSDHLPLNPKPLLLLLAFPPNPKS